MMKDILIVEDGKQERERLAQLFKTAGYSVVSCESVTEAEISLKDYEYRLAILDIGLNDKSGSHLFSTLKQTAKASIIIIFTGNPSVHLKQRFIDEGAGDYIVKASPQAQSEAFLSRVVELIGSPTKGTAEGLDLSLFLERYVSPKSRQLFLESDNTLPACSSCQSRSYIVSFSEQPQIPPTIQGVVICSACGKPMDPQVV